MAGKLLDKDNFFKKYNIEADALEKTGLNWKDLEDIYIDHSQNTPNLQPTANYIVERLRQVPAVHSLRIRIKDPEHLVEKIIRKKLDNKDLDISVENYKDNITDLIGVRALHLFKDDWNEIHDFVEKTWKLKEQPTANVREGDPEEYTRQFTEKGCKINNHKFGYRSVHYLIMSNPSKEIYVAELQVRTIFEEGWSEIDHSIRYPYDLDNLILAQVSAIHNRLAGSADEIGSFIKILKRELQERDARYSSAINEQDRLLKELNDKIETLGITKAEKKDLEDRLQSLSANSRQNLVPNYSKMIAQVIASIATPTMNPAIIQSILDANRRIVASRVFIEPNPTATESKSENSEHEGQSSPKKSDSEIAVEKPQKKNITPAKNSTKKTSPKNLVKKNKFIQAKNSDEEK